MQPFWSSRAEELVGQLIAQLPKDKFAGSPAERLNALPVFGSMWAAYFLRPTGEVVIVGEDFDEPDMDSVYSDRGHVLPVLVSASRRYPELRELLPVRGPEDVDCRCRSVSVFAEGKVICPVCKGLGWLSEDVLNQSDFFTNG